MYKFGFLIGAITCFTYVHAVDFVKDVKPILEAKCVSCHGADKDKGDLRLHTHEELIKGKVVKVGDADKSSLVELISLPEDHDDIMPPKGDPLNKEQISKVKAWIKAGAKWPKGIILKDRSKEPKTAEVKMVAKNDAFKHLVPIINKYCTECHNADKEKGDFRIDNMDQDLVYGIHAQRWYEVLDQLNLGEMPPKKAKQPNDKERRALIEGLTTELDKAKKFRKGQISTVMRRLNNEQYNNTLRDLLGVDFNFAKDLPEDGISPEGFKNNGSTLGMSTMQMEYYLANARKALDKAIPLGPPEVTKFRVDFGYHIQTPIKERLIMGPGSRLIPSQHYKVTAPKPVRPYDFVHIKVRDQFIFNEGYSGNGTVKGRKEFKGYHHAVYPELDNSNDKAIPQGLMLAPRGDLQFGKAGQRGPSNHMKLVVRDFPQSGPITIRVTASKAPNSLFMKFTGKEVISDSSNTISKLKSNASYPKGSNLETPKFIVSADLEVKEAGMYQLDARLFAEIDGKANIHIGDTLLEGVRIKKGAANLVVPIAIVKLPKGKTSIKITAKKKADIAEYALTKLQDNDGKIKNFQKGVKRTKNIATFYSGRALAKYNSKNNLLEKVTVALKASKARVIKEGEYNVPKPTNFLIVKSFEVPSDAIYQIDFKLNEKPKSSLDLKIDSSTARGLNFNFKAGTPSYSTSIMKLNKGSHKIFISSKSEIPLESFSVSLVNNSETEKIFAEYEASQYGYLRAFIGSRRDDGQEYDLLPQIIKVDAPLNKPQVIEFNAHIDDYPLPAYDPKNKNFLANLMHIGIWNTPWNAKKNTNVVIHSIEFESNVSPTWPPKTHKDIFIDSQKGDEKTYAKAILAKFLTKAYRRQISTAELNRHLGFFEAIRSHKPSLESAIKEVLAIALSSPQFLYINEPEGTSVKNLTEAELASRLSYFLWDTMPDAELMEAAKNKTLKRDLKKHINRMILHPKSYSFSKNFANQWLDVDRIDRVVVDRKHSNGYQKDIKNSYKKETYAFFHHVLQNNKSIMDFIDSDYAVLDWRTASFYGLPAVDSLHFKAVPVRKENNRGGVLTHGSLLTALSTGKHGSPIKRGVWLAKRIVDSPPPKPPPNVPELDEENPALAKLSMKKQLETHRDNASCRDCHMKIDPWGIPFEFYNTVGKFNNKDKKVETDTVFPDGTKVDGLDELKSYIIKDKKEQVSRSLVKFLSSYAAGRSLSFTDEDEIKRLVKEAEKNGYKLQAIIESIVNSEIFLKF